MIDLAEVYIHLYLLFKLSKTMKIQVCLIVLLQVYSQVCKNFLLRSCLFENYYSTPAPELVLLVGDLHGDYKALNRILTYTNYSSSNLLVSIGDVIGRGDDTQLLMKYFMTHTNTLHILGNHEHLNMKGQFAYVSNGDILSFGNVENRFKAFDKGGLYYEYLSSRPVVVKLGDILMVHAGLSLEIAGKYEDIGEINRKFWTNNQLTGTIGPIWYRGFAHGSENEICDDVGKVLEIYKCKFMLMGHTVFKEITTKCAGKAVFVDTGISYAMASRESALEILQSAGETVQLKAVYPDKFSIIYSA